MNVVANWLATAVASEFAICVMYLCSSFVCLGGQFNDVGPNASLAAFWVLA